LSPHFLFPTFRGVSFPYFFAGCHLCIVNHDTQGRPKLDRVGKTKTTKNHEKANIKNQLENRQNRKPYQRADSISGRGKILGYEDYGKITLLV
jgi:hypothetical protein